MTTDHPGRAPHPGPAHPGPAPRWFDDGRLHFGLGVEDTFVPQERAGERAVDEYELTEHYEQVEGDLALAREVGAEFLRWGIPWHRVNPAPGEWDWSWLDRAMAAFGENGIRPVVDLLHYGTPLWLEREFAHPDYPQRVAEYAVAVAERYRDVATDYTPVNEPMIHALFSGEYAYWPPYLGGVSGLVTVSDALAHGFVLTQRGIAEVLGDRASFVHVDATLRYAGDTDAAEHRETAERLRHQAFLVEDLVTGNVGPEHPLVALLGENGLSDDRLAWYAANAVQPDVMGVNYYPRHSTELFEAGVTHGGGFADPRPTVDHGTDGLIASLQAYATRYGAPVMVTETCVTDTPAARIDWLDRSVAAVEAARADGLLVVGYTWWPLFDMYEWTYRHSTAPRSEHLLTMGLFDLIENDTPGGPLLRRANPVAARFREHALGARAGSAASASSPTTTLKG
ncbi:family 1 glycosylhydrolase [Herbiconiux sp. KACC 21604]|uniref:family 1 glycosylhydrolase n=1 Tax=unclassified Herbiconiux TaxID=2618217 RepID=UPI001490D4E1|nr:family 1 glycosylhydrolase [Herbiconiux sp. SALV-R1]QJU54211.1 family 1 glycosylhydrolase [Herbiconiux sp. SALV-R1]WPO85269.1 family 1 glycosylhydrolase [Herbiconiux sp. KACC 21604]